MQDFLVEGRVLDAQQMECVTEQHHNHLVVAGAGTGKTTTIVGKIKWLLEHGIFRAEEILVLSFTNASAAEMRERILTEVRETCDTGGEVTVATFHKLGLEILKSANKDFRISKLNLQSFVMGNLPTEEIMNAERIAQIIALCRTNGVPFSQVTEKMKRHGRWRNLFEKEFTDEDHALIKTAAEIAAKYEKTLRERNEIDFADMINLATEYVRSGKYQNPHKFVIVDEYQDISMPRYNLLKSLRESRDFDLFCVGDDWQAIYRFAGSEIDLILNFETYWGETKISKIETTYRFPQTLANVSGKFVMENGAQIVKKIRALPDTDFSVVEICADAALDGLDHTAKLLRELPENSTVFFLGRYTHDKNFLKMLPHFKLQKDGSVKFGARPDLEIKFLTAHKSKGLQADFVFVMNLKNAQMGFPSKVESDEMTKLLHGKVEKFPHAEERRLFYVALTRAKKKVYLLTTHGHKSEFVVELEDLFYRKMPIVNFGLLED